MVEKFPSKVIKVYRSKCIIYLSFQRQHQWWHSLLSFPISRKGHLRLISDVNLLVNLQTNKEIPSNLPAEQRFQTSPHPQTSKTIWYLHTPPHHRHHLPVYTYKHMYLLLWLSLTRGLHHWCDILSPDRSIGVWLLSCPTGSSLFRSVVTFILRLWKGVTTSPMVRFTGSLSNINVPLSSSLKPGGWYSWGVTATEMLRSDCDETITLEWDYSSKQKSALLVFIFDTKLHWQNNWSLHETSIKCFSIIQKKL